MAYTAWLPPGSTLQINLANVFTNIPGVTSVSFSGGDRPQIPYTALSDTAPKSISGMQQPFQASAAVEWDPRDTTQQAIYTEANATTQTKKNWKAILPWSGVNNTISFDGYVGAFLPGGLKGEEIPTTELKINIDGTITV